MKINKTKAEIWVCIHTNISALVTLYQAAVELERNNC